MFKHWRGRFSVCPCLRSSSRPNDLSLVSCMRMTLGGSWRNMNKDLICEGRAIRSVGDYSFRSISRHWWNAWIKITVGWVVSLCVNVTRFPIRFSTLQTEQGHLEEPRRERESERASPLLLHYCLSSRKKHFRVFLPIPLVFKGPTSAWLSHVVSSSVRYELTFIELIDTVRTQKHQRQSTGDSQWPLQRTQLNFVRTRLIGQAAAAAAANEWIIQRSEEV